MIKSHALGVPMNTQHISTLVSNYYRDLMINLESSVHSYIITPEVYQQCILHASEIGYLCHHTQSILKACDNLTLKIQDHIPLPWRPSDPI